MHLNHYVASRSSHLPLAGSTSPPDAQAALTSPDAGGAAMQTSPLQASRDSTRERCRTASPPAAWLLAPHLNQLCSCCTEQLKHFSSQLPARYGARREASIGMQVGMVGSPSRQAGKVVNLTRCGSETGGGETFPFHLLPAFSTRYLLSTPRADVPAGNRLSF